MKVKRKYDENEIVDLLVKSGGRCMICNANIMNDWITKDKIQTFERAHIKSFSDNGPRSDLKLSNDEKNSSDNLMILCSNCHTIIDKKISEKKYTVEWLVELKKNKIETIKKILDTFTPIKCTIVKYCSVINDVKFDFNDSELNNSCFLNGFFIEDNIISLSDNINNENLEASFDMLKDNYLNRIQRQLDMNRDNEICLFACAPQPLLIYLGKLLSDIHKIHVFTLHRNKTWVYNNINQNNDFYSIKPNIINEKNKIALVCSSTALIDENRVKIAIGENVDIWRINAIDIGIDKINNQEELTKYSNELISIIDEIGRIYGKNSNINLFSALCNSLAIITGMTVFPKSHNIINIFDCVKENGIIKDTLKLII